MEWCFRIYEEFMVLHQVLAIYLGYLTPIPAQGISEQVALERAIAFCRAVERGPHEPTGAQPLKLNVERFKRELSWIGVYFQNAFVGINLRSGKINGYSDRRGYPREFSDGRPSLTVTEAQNQAVLAHRLAGFTEDLQPYSWQLDRNADFGWGSSDNYFFHFLQAFNGVPFTEEFGVWVRVERTSGRLLWYDVLAWELPTAPVDLIPAISAEMARGHILARVYDR
jgi:hypothetical protein